MIQYQRIPEMRTMCEDLRDRVQGELHPVLAGVITDLANTIISLSYDVEKHSEYRSLIREWVDHDHPDGSGWSVERIARARALLEE